MNCDIETPLKTCLGEIDRCAAENIAPFFINMISERIGWIPNEDQIPFRFIEEYSWIKGMSVTEMEIMHGAYRSKNPNGKLNFYCFTILALN